MRKSPSSLWLIGLFLAALAGLPDRPGAAAAPAPAADTLTAAQRKEIVDLLAAFKRSRKAPAERTKVVDRILEIGGGAPALLADAINRELQPARDHYRVAYAKRLAQVMASMARSGELKDVETLRQSVLALTWRREPTKEEIAATADPAMAKLNNLLLPAAAVILKSDSGLWNERNDLVELGTNWQRASDAAAKPDAPAPAPARFEDILADQERLAALVVLTKEESGQKVLVANEALEAALDPEEARCIRDLNRVRVLLGLGPLRIDPGLCSAARDHSTDMVKQKFFSHESPVAGKRNFQDRARKFGSAANGENIAEGQPTGAAVNQDWFHSPAHHLNMMNRHWSRVGVGRFEKTWTEMFG